MRHNIKITTSHPPDKVTEVPPIHSVLCDYLFGLRDYLFGFKTHATKQGHICDSLDVCVMFCQYEPIQR